MKGLVGHGVGDSVSKESASHAVDPQRGEQDVSSLSIDELGDRDVGHALRPLDSPNALAFRGCRGLT